ncbi:MAG: hypothetical protein ACYC1M_17760 [Armatimonadota bacterium]
MSITVTLADVKLLAYEEGSTNDAAVTALMNLLVPAIEERLDSSRVTEYSSTNWVKLAVTKIIAGEWVARRARLIDPESTVVDSTASLPLADRRDDPSGLISAGWNALLPLVKDEFFWLGSAEWLGEESGVRR